MGVIGGVVGNEIGSHLGGYLGSKVNEKYRGSGSAIGSAIGSLVGSLAPYKMGGRVKGKKGKAIPVLAHGGEYILPVGIKPTKTQMNAIEKRKRKK